MMLYQLPTLYMLNAERWWMMNLKSCVYDLFTVLLQELSVKTVGKQCLVWDLNPVHPGCKVGMLTTTL
jgi:hypothetical protein